MKSSKHSTPPTATYNFTDRDLSIVNSGRIGFAIYSLVLLLLVYIGRILELVPGLYGYNVGKIIFGLSFFLYITSFKKNTFSLADFLQTKLIFGLFIMCLVSVPFSAWPGGSIEFIFVKYVKVVLFYLLLISLVDKVKELEALFWGIGFSVLALGLSAVSAETTGRSSASRTYDPNDLAFVMVTFLPILYYFMRQKNGVSKLFLQGVLVVMFITVLSTVSRGGLLGLLVVCIMIYSKQSHRIRQATIPAIIILGIFVCFASEEYWERMSTLLHPTEDYNMTDTGGRINIWKNGLKMIIARPLNGHGVGVFEVVEGQLHEGIGKWSSPHNSFIQVGAEIGLVGLFFFYQLLKTSIIYLRRSQLREVKDCAVPLWILDGTEISFYGYIVTGFFLSQAHSPVLYFLLAVVVIIQKFDKTLDAHPLVCEQRSGL